MRATDIKIYYVTVEAVLRQYESLFIFPRLLFSLYLIKLDFQLFLSLLILLRNHIMILLDSFVEITKLLQLVVKKLFDLKNVFSEISFNRINTIPELFVSFLRELRKYLQINLHWPFFLQLVDWMTHWFEVAQGWIGRTCGTPGWFYSLHIYFGLNYLLIFILIRIINKIKV